jgi:SPP1 gp7 family putative phage head morphogenesis protein
VIYDPRQPSFWADEYIRMTGEFKPLALRILFAGIQQGASALPGGLDVLVNWDWINTAALDWLNRWGAETLYGINETSRKGVVKAIDDWIRSGEPLPSLSARLDRIYGDPRITQTAETEVTRMYAEGNLQAWKSTGLVTEKIWQTANDERVCPICGPLHGTTVGIDSGWSMDAGGEIVSSYGGLLAPPAHNRCRCWLAPVVSEDALRQRLREELRR